MNKVETTPCKACRRPIRWVKTQKNAVMPLDPEPCEDGNIMLDSAGRAVHLGKAAAGVVGVKYKSHYATCSDPRRFRRA